MSHTIRIPQPRSSAASDTRANNGAVRPTARATPWTRFTSISVLAMLAAATAPPSSSAPTGDTARTADTRFERQAPGAPVLDNKLALAISNDPLSPPADKDPDPVLERMSEKDFDGAIAAANEKIKADPGDPAGYNLLGGAYLGRGDFANARKSFEKALEVRKDYSYALINLAQLDLMDKNFGSARKRYEAVLAGEPKNAAAMVGMARIEAANNNDKAGLEWLTRAKIADPGAAAPRILLATYHMRNRNFSEALQELNEAASYNPANGRILDLLGQAEFASGQRSRAVATYRRWTAAEPQSAFAYYRLAAAQAANDNVVGAESSLTTALRLQPGYPEATNALASIYLRKGRQADALKLAKDLQARSPGIPDGYVLEGDVLMAKQQPAAAVGLYEKALSVREAPVIAIKLHEALFKAGNRPAAVKSLERWLERNPADMEVRQVLARAYLQTGQPKEAIAEYQAILQKDPKNVSAYNNLANLYYALKDPRAIETAEAAYRLEPDSPAVLDTLGWILVNRGKAERGVELLRKAAGAAPKNWDIRYHYAASLAKTGDKAGAREQLERLLATAGPGFAQRAEAQALLKQL